MSVEVVEGQRFRARCWVLHHGKPEQFPESVIDSLDRAVNNQGIRIRNLEDTAEIVQANLLELEELVRQVPRRIGSPPPSYSCLQRS